jgi:hypothetical protein
VRPKIGEREKSPMPAAGSGKRKGLNAYTFQVENRLRRNQSREHLLWKIRILRPEAGKTPRRWIVAFSELLLAEASGSREFFLTDPAPKICIVGSHPNRTKRG